jgi:putative spermidine/putrescine transport system substrate-binding protein
MRTPTSYSGLAYVGMALEFGGDEHNIDPAFDYLKELAERGNIGRVAGSDVDAINSMTTGETAFGFGVGNVWERIAEGVPIEVLMRVPGDTGFKGLPYKDGWVVLKGPKAELAKEFANYSIGPEANTAIAGALASAPTNSKATISEAARQWSYEPDELDRYTYFPDFGHLSEQVNDWSVRFEREITPLLRG